MKVVTVEVSSYVESAAFTKLMTQVPVEVAVTLSGFDELFSEQSAAVLDGSIE
ncbi:unannotated protein [freshwater metagenome]|uniref:Unannotated protein n=1 Tax=freshwater metagenome TaxID=449393 RepID=A0A6J6L840_9ZZZZ